MFLFISFPVVGQQAKVACVCVCVHSFQDYIKTRREWIRMEIQFFFLFQFALVSSIFNAKLIFVLVGSDAFMRYEIREGGDRTMFILIFSLEFLKLTNSVESNE